MSQRGQVTIEALLIIGFFLIVLIGVSVPMAWESKRTAIDVTSVADAKFAVEQIASAASSVTTPGSKRTIEVWVPAYSARSISTSITLEGGKNMTATVSLPDGDRVIRKSLYGGGWTLDPATLTVSSGRGARYTAVVAWSSDASTKTITLTAN